MNQPLPSRPRVGVVGATGAVGRALLDLMVERDFPASEVRTIASARSAGMDLPFGDSTLRVIGLSKESLAGLDLVLLDVPDEVAREWAPIAVEAGAVVVDNSAAWRMEAGVPLVVPEVNPGDIGIHTGIIASPNCTTIGVVLPLHALRSIAPLEKVIVSSYQATSGAGREGVEELKEQSSKLVGDLDALATSAASALAPAPSIFSKAIAFNVVPQVGSFRDLDYTGEEWKLLHESRKIMGLEDLDVTATCVRVPTVVGHGSAVWARFADAVTPNAAKEVLASAAGIVLDEVPNPLEAAGRDPVVVGRIRQDASDPRALWFFCVSDNLRKGAALNTLQVAEILVGSRS